MFRAASAAAVVATLSVALLLTVPGSAQILPGDTIFEPASPIATGNDLPAPSLPAETADDGAAPDAVDADSGVAIRRGSTLSEHVDLHRSVATDNAEHRCLAIGIYYESRAEPLEGQLAVANVILNRARSGRFADSVCGVLTQRGQFSFVRGGVLPTPRQDAHWRTAVAVARIALDDSWADPVPGALFFHAARVSPGWNRPRLARLGNHVFYR